MKIPSLLKKVWDSARVVRSHAAETLAEVLIALIVLVVGGGGAMTLVIMSIHANQENEERLMAYNLAREGVEAIRSVRDSNWVRFPLNREDCWDALPNVELVADCPTNQLAVTSYLVYPEIGPNTSQSLNWHLTQGYTSDELCMGEINGQNIYVHEGLTGCTTLSPTPFSREVSIISKGVDSMEIRSTVTWESKGQTKEVRFVDELTNY